MNFIADIPLWQARFEAYMRDHEDDAAHDISHLRRVWRNAQQIMQQEQANQMVVLAACYFHDFVNLAKDSPNRASASTLSAERSEQILSEDFPDFPAGLIDDVKHAIQAHSFSANITPQTVEAKIVQDADRLEALGPIGLMRVFYTAGRLNSGMFNADDTLAENRPLNDKEYALDHFQIKLLKIPDTMQTQVGRELAQQGADYLRDFMHTVDRELACG